MKHRFSIVIEHKAGAVARIVGALHTRGLEIEELRVARQGGPGLALVTLVTEGEEKTMAGVAQKIGQQVRVLRVGHAWDGATEGSNA